MAGEKWHRLVGGKAITHPQVPEVWDASFLARVNPSADATRLLIQGRRHLATQGCRHVRILLDDPRTFGTVGADLSGLGMIRRVYATLCTNSVPTAKQGHGRIKFEPVASEHGRGIMAKLREEVRSQASWFASEVNEALDTWENIQEATLDLTWLIAYLDGVPASAAGLLLTPCGASLQSLATAPALRRRGVASALVREVVARGLEAGAPYVSLLTDSEDRPKGLYKKLGFQQVGEVHEYIQILA